MRDAPRISRAQFVDRVRQAAKGRKGFAAGKIGNCEQFQLYWPILQRDFPAQRQQRAAALALGYHGARQTGVFPDGPEFLSRYLPFYVDRLRDTDVLGIFDTPGEPAIVAFHDLPGPFCHFLAQEPGRASPDVPEDCYLPAFAGKRVLIVSPFADLLVSRANASDFEAVWAKTGKRWFAPAHVEGLTMFYGWHESTQRRFADSLAMFDFLAAEMGKREFDLALISAGGLGVPLAVEAKRLGAVGISLGGHLQVLFGVLGGRWRSDPEWQTRYINQAWIDLPENLRPDRAAQHLTDGGAYW